MAVQVSRDLTVQVLSDVNITKLADRQQALRAAIQRGEPKSLGVSGCVHEANSVRTLRRKATARPRKQLRTSWSFSLKKQETVRLCLHCLCLHIKKMIFIDWKKHIEVHVKRYLPFCCFRLTFETWRTDLYLSFLSQVTSLFCCLLTCHNVWWFFQEVVASRFHL